MGKIKRNDPCICGSGEKYKKCCLQSNDQMQSKNPPPSIKISEAILQIAEPLLEKFSSEQQIRPIISLAVLAWNLSLAPAEEREDFKNEIIERMPVEMKEENVATIMEQVDMFAVSKDILFPDINYFIVDYNLSFDGSGKYTLDINSIESFLKKQ